jgi:thioesterase domain-containing protein
VREVAVVARGEGGEARLCAYVIPSDGAPAGGDLREHLRARLPEYMIPSITVVDSLPRSASGKVDRRALLARGGEAAGPTYVAPRTEAEVAMCSIWQEVLGLDRVGVEDDFFALGGSSLLLIRLSVLARERLGINLSVSSIMGQPTIAALAEGNLGRSHLVPLGAGSGASREAVVFVHSLSGEVFPYLELARCLPDHATYGLRSPIDDEPEPIRTLAELAAIHAGSLAALERPIHLVGWSAGGIIAHEIAHQLDTLGCPARTLTLLDPPAPNQGEASIPDPIAAMLSLIGDRPLPRVAEGEEDAALVVAEALACEVATAQLLLARQMKHHRLVAAHKPASIGTPTLVLSCDERDDLGPWNDLAPVRAARAEGNHYTMLRGVSVRAVARGLQQHLAGPGAATWDECR